MTSRRSLFLASAIFWALAETCWGQRSWNWRGFSLADGLSESACVSVSTSPQGNVLVRHLNLASVSELNGYSVTGIPAPAAAASRIHESPGGQLWTAAPDGVAEFKNGRWLVHPVREIANAFRSPPQRTSELAPLCPVRQGLVIFLLADQLMEFSAEDPDNPQTFLLLEAGRTKLGRFTAMTVARDGGLWVTGTGGLLKIPGPLRSLKPDCNFQEYLPDDSFPIQDLRDPHDDDEDGVTAIADLGTNRASVMAHFDGKSWTNDAALPPRVRHAWCNDNKTCWAVTPDSLFQGPRGAHELAENEEIGARQYFDVAVDPGGVFWLATSDGLFRYAPLLWQSPAAVARGNSPVPCLVGDPDLVWFVAGNLVCALPLDNQPEHVLFSFSLPGDEAPRALYPLKNGTLLVETGEQLMQLRVAGPRLSAMPFDKRGSDLRPLGLLNNRSLCFQVADRNSSGANCRLESYDGTGFTPLAEAPSDPLFGTNFTRAFATQNGDLWLGSESGIAVNHDKRWRTFVASDGTVPRAPLNFAELPDGRLWCATQDKIWEFDGRNWTGIRGGFDRINALVRSRDGSVWVASNNGLFRFLQNAWVENGVEEGLPGTVVRQLCEDARGRLWAGTTHGLCLYHPEADQDPPQTTMHELSEKESRMPAGQDVSLSFGGLDKWKQTSRIRLLYSYRLDERDWSPFLSESIAQLGDLPAGRHYFQARAMDRNCNIDPKPARIEFAVVLPWYKELRLVAIALAGLTGALFFAAVAFNRHRRLVHSYAEVEQKVTERTRELELANRALVHSQKMNALGTLAAGIAHDFNNILSIIKGSAQIIGDNLDDQRKVTTRVERINTAVEQGTGIVKAMLGFSRDSDQQAALCDANAIVEETLKLLGDRFLREVQVSFERTPDLPKVVCSPDFVQQILLNFIFNAAESMTKPKRVILATRLANTSPHAALAPASAPAYVAISVRDFGCGIAPEHLPRIFEPFFTTKAFSARRGTGLGLSMAYELAKKLEAGLTVESAVDRGSTFTLILPVGAGPK
jgi:signal transduction histidine kinase